MKKNILITSLLFFLCVKCFAQAITEDMVVGTWLTADSKAKIRIYKEGTTYHGKIVWLKNPLYDDGKVKTDKNNPDKTKQTVPIIGLILLKDFKFNNNQWEDGTIYDPENGKSYSCKITYHDGKLYLRGYVGISLIGRTQTWFKVSAIK